MTDDEILLSHARDLKSKSADNGMITNTAFLDMRQRTLLLSTEKEQSKFVSQFYYGGHGDAERTVCVFIPRFYEVDSAEEYFRENPADNPLSLIRIEKDKFTSLSHRDYLGALMGLSIKREMLGDILPDENGAFVVCLKTVERFILENLTGVGRATATCRRAELSEANKAREHFEEVFSSVASTRLDCVVAAAFKLSRGNAAKAIESGVVFANGVQILKTDYKVAEGEKIVLRGSGKAVLSEIKGESKKGRTHIVFKRYG